jgi:hypothetical protein
MGVKIVTFVYFGETRHAGKISIRGVGLWLMEHGISSTKICGLMETGLKWLKGTSSTLINFESPPPLSCVDRLLFKSCKLQKAIDERRVSIAAVANEG